MKHVKRAAFAALAVVALASIFATTASANAKICSTAGTGAACKSGHGNVYTGKVDGKLSGLFNWTATNAAGEKRASLTCAESTVEGEVTNGETGSGKITRLLLSQCSSATCSSPLSFSIALLPWTFTAETTTPEVENTNGLLKTGEITGAFGCTYFGIAYTCRYKLASATFHVTGSDTAPTMSVDVVTEREEGLEFACGVKADWTATYSITTPSSLFVE
jgi:hypothetical protein